MKNWKARSKEPLSNRFISTTSNLVKIVMMTVLMLMVGGLASAANPNPNPTPMTPELAAKREMIRKQQEQRITPDKRKKAIDALKAERLKVYNAKQLVNKSKPLNDNK